MHPVVSGNVRAVWDRRASMHPRDEQHEKDKAVEEWEAEQCREVLREKHDEDDRRLTTTKEDPSVDHR